MPASLPKLLSIMADTTQQTYKKRVSLVYALALRFRKCCGDTIDPAKRAEVEVVDAETALERGYCGYEQPDYYTRYETVLVRPVYNVETDTPMENIRDRYPVITPATMYNALHFANEFASRALGFHPQHAPIGALMNERMSIPPLLMRPSRSSHSEDDLSTRIRLIVKINQAAIDSGNVAAESNLVMFKVGKKSNVGDDLVESEVHTRNKTSVVPKMVDNYFDLSRHAAGYQFAKMFVRLDADFGRDRASVRHRFMPSKSQRGRVRATLLGKRGDFTGRGVAILYNLMDIDQILVPISVLMKLTMPCIVTKHNYTKMLAIVLAGNVYPGCNFVERNKQLYSPNVAMGGLKIGDIVHRHLVKDDLVILNRQPTLHRFGFLAFRVLPHNGNSIGTHVGITCPYNLDYDGDELNLFGLTDLQSLAEAYELLHVNKNIFSDGKLVVTFTQHACLSIYMLTLKADAPILTQYEISS